MPYRRLPNTNRARLRSLSQVVAVGRKHDEAGDLAFEYTLLEQAATLLPQYERRVLQYEQSRSLQRKNSRACSQESKMARMYVSHFIQVLDMCVMRGEIKAELKELYGLDPERHSLPDLASDENLAVWGRKIIDGETKRKQQGGIPIYNPPITKVMVYFDQFIDKYSGHQVLRANTSRSSSSIVELNGMVDKLLLAIWNQVEQRFSTMEEQDKLSRCCEYGLIYYYRKGERPEMGKVSFSSDNVEAALPDVFDDDIEY